MLQVTLKARIMFVSCLTYVFYITLQKHARAQLSAAGSFVKCVLGRKQTSSHGHVSLLLLISFYQVIPFWHPAYCNVFYTNFYFFSY
jgi:hypothetical protein